MDCKTGPGNSNFPCKNHLPPCSENGQNVNSSFHLVASASRILGLCGAFFLLTATPRSAGAQETTHAVVPAYERFRDDLDAITAGQLLVSELNCQSCHGKALPDVLPQRQAPILTGVATRAHASHLLQFLQDPQKIKPGTAMPHVLTGDDAQEKATAIVHFLAAEGAAVPTPVTGAAVQLGEQAFHTLGCAACHGDLRQPVEERPTFAMPLGPLDTKYTVNGLASFLKNPHTVRPSGRMPSLNLSEKEAFDVACYLLQNIEVEPNLTVEYYEGKWDKLPDFNSLKPKSTGPAVGIDVSPAQRRDRFGLRFTGWLQVPTDGEYQFWLASDDGSRLRIDGNEIVAVDGIHPRQEKSNKVKLMAGPHPVVVEYFEDGGEEVLSAEIGGPGMPRQPLSGYVTQSKVPPQRKGGFRPDARLAAEGKLLFQQSGCVACHQHQRAPKVEQTVPAFAEANLASGCLSAAPGPGVPRFALTEQQRGDITMALEDARKQQPTSPQNSIHQIMLTLNCYGCHQRDTFGGVPRPLDHIFTGSIPEMGDEGRIPPYLNGIGDKLKPDWLRHVMNNGTKDRPYMTTRMPKFGEENVGQLVALLAKHDVAEEVAEVEFTDPPHRVKASARLMVGDQALSCIKCHTFDKHRAIGIQSLDMTTLTKRLRRDWFHRYLLDPQTYRPGTRMPAAWPRGRSVVPKILHGDSSQQIEAIWQYLAAGNKARIPSGLVTKAIELKPESKPIIYRNFIQGLSARGIAVGTPLKAHYAWDAEQMNVRLIWQGEFIDAAKHWVGRGPGYQTPLGDGLIEFPNAAPLALLEKPDEKWPVESARSAGYRFRGYQLNAARLPAFRYEWKGIQVTDLIEAQQGDQYPVLQRTLKFESEAPQTNLYLRIAATGSISKTDKGFLIDDSVLIQCDEGRLRESEGKQELIVPVMIAPGQPATITYRIVW